MEKSKRTLSCKRSKHNILKWLLTLVLFMAMPLLFLSCGDAPAGAEGPQGPEGPEGPVGPAGEDGSMIYAGEGDPGGDIGDLGDYYLNQNTGEFYGPKDEDGWGEPIIVLMGEDGKGGEDGRVIHSGEGAPGEEVGTIGDFYFDETSGDFYGPKTEEGWGNPTDLTGEDGQDGSIIHSGEGAPGENDGAIGDYYLDKSTGELYGQKTESGWGDPIDLTGQDGQDGEDGSQIHSGDGAPDASLGVVGDYYLDKSSYELYGPKTSDGWGTPLNLKGADGNANVTRYIFPGHDFSEDGYFEATIDIDGDPEDSAWLAYLVRNWKYPVPGFGVAGQSEYRFYYGIDTANMIIQLVDGQGYSGEAYSQVEIIQIETSIVEDLSKQQAKKNIIPDHLDTSNYEEVADYYGFYNE